MIFWRCRGFALSNHLGDCTFVAKAFFDLSASLVVDLFEFSSNSTLLFEQALDVTDFALRLQQVSMQRFGFDSLSAKLRPAEVSL